MMKKRKPQWTNRISPTPKNSVLVSNQFRLKQIYQSGNTSHNRSPKNSQKKDSLATRYQLPLTDRKRQNNKVNKYQAYLQNQVISKIKQNKRYSKLEKEDNEHISQKKQLDRKQNQSVDMFKIRKKRPSVHKVSASSHLKLNESMNNFEEGKQLYKQKRYEEALTVFQLCLKEQPNNCQFMYYSAIIYLNKHKYKEGLQLMEKIIKIDPIYKKSVYLFAAISAKNLNQLNQAHRFCNAGINEYSKYTQLILYRGKILQAQGKYEEAHQDFESVLSQEKNSIETLLLNAKCLKKMDAYSNCLSNLAAALYIDNGENKKNILTMRIEIYLETDNLKQAKKDMNKLLSLGEQLTSDILYLKGSILLRDEFKKEAILCFQQCLKQATDKQPMCKALIEITKTKIDDRDFYSAYYHINRSQHLGLENSQIEIYRYFAEGVVYLMKRKIQDGDHNFEYLIEHYPKLTPYIQKIFYLYRAFGKFMLSNYEEAIEDYERAHEHIPLDLYARYNKLLAEGIVKANSKNYEEAIALFNVAQKTLENCQLNKIQSYLYRGATHIQKAKDFIEADTQMEDLKSLEEIFSGLKELDKAYDINDSNSNMLYFRGLVYLYLGKYEEALQDVVKAISKSEENVAKYFFFRGLTHASLNNKKQALNDLNICTNLDEKFGPAHLEKAKINFSNENTTKAIEDLVKLANINPKQDVKYHECCLNFIYGHNLLANSCIAEIKDKSKAQMMKVLLLLRLGKIKEAMKYLNSSADKMICQIMLNNTEIEEQPPTDLQYFNIFHYYHYLGLKEYKQQNYEKAIDNFIMAVKQKNLYDLEQGISNNNLQEEADEEIDEDEETQADIINRMNYNIFLCYLLAEEHKKGYEAFIKDVLGAKQSLLKNQFMGSFSHLLFQSMKSGCEKQFEEKQVYELNIYECKLDNLYDQVIIELPNFVLKTKMCFLALNNPKIQRQYKPKANPQFILEYMKLGEIENRPEPPWVKRKEEGLIFTDEVQNIQIQFQTTENEEEEEEEDNEDDEEEYEEQSEDPSQRMSLNKFKQKMKLDDSIERKLQKIMDKKQ